MSDHQAAHANDRKPARPSEWPDALDRPELAPTQLDHGVAKVRLVSKTAIETYGDRQRGRLIPGKDIASCSTGSPPLRVIIAWRSRSAIDCLRNRTPPSANKALKPPL